MKTTALAPATLFTAFLACSPAAEVREPATTPLPPAAEPPATAQVEAPPAAPAEPAAEPSPEERKKAEELSRSALPDPAEPEGRDAALASAVEFILEGLHVHNKLNKNVKPGGTASYCR